MMQTAVYSNPISKPAKYDKVTSPLMLEAVSHKPRVPFREVTTILQRFLAGWPEYPILS
jgi:hypothetical protein